MTKMRREYNPNQAASRKRRPVIYIVCEGKETEIKYFRHFRTRDCLVDIVPISSKHRAAEQLVRHAKDMVKPAAYYPMDGDKIWCVFDCDSNTNEALSKAGAFAERSGYGVAYSNPCFEYWFLLHFTEHTGYINGADEALRLLRERNRLENYEKNRDVFPDLRKLQKTAIHRAENRVAQLQEDGLAILSRDSNPCTTVYRLVECLKQQSE